jgi:hypothetical protein
MLRRQYGLPITASMRCKNGKQQLAGSGLTQAVPMAQS